MEWAHQVASSLLEWSVGHISNANEDDTKLMHYKVHDAMILVIMHSLFDKLKEQPSFYGPMMVSFYCRVALALSK
jgi:hypothetical protein